MVDGTVCPGTEALSTFSAIVLEKKKVIFHTLGKNISLKFSVTWTEKITVITIENKGNVLLDSLASQGVSSPLHHH